MVIMSRRRHRSMVQVLRLAALFLFVFSWKGISAWSSTASLKSLVLGESTRTSMRILSSSSSRLSRATMMKRPHQYPPLSDLLFLQQPPRMTRTTTLFLGAGSIRDYYNARTTTTTTTKHATIASQQRRWWSAPTPVSTSTRTTTTARMFGSRVGSTDVPGIVTIMNEQDALKDVNLDKLRTTAHDIRHLLGYDTYDLNILLVDDEEMREANRESRGVDRPTDILSFQFHDCVRGVPGRLEEPRFDIPDYYTLGDILIDVPYVMRVCDDDAAAAAAADADSLDDDEEWDDRGVAAAMEEVRDPERRMQMLLVHGMLHLVGYDHEDDDDYEAMVTKEDEFLEKLGMKSTSTS